MKGDRGKRLQRLRCEFVERTFAHICETRGSETHLAIWGEKARKCYLIAATAHNLGVLNRVLFKNARAEGTAGVRGHCLVYLDSYFITFWHDVRRHPFAFRPESAL